jgi:hypothetical protein
MSTQKEIKEELINFQIRAVDLISSSIQSPKAMFPDQQSFNFNISVEQKLDANSKCLIVITHIEITTAEDSDYKLATCSVACLFGIENYSDVVKIDNNQVTISPTIIEILNSISYSTTRGVLSQVLRGTYLHQAILPIIDPKTFKKTAKR